MLDLRRFLPLFLFVALAVGACRSNAPATASARDGCHPACPGARQAELADAGAVLRGSDPRAPEPAAPARAPSTAAYLCPMHPWIGSDAPGRCPECEMKLVERALVLEHDHGH